MRARKLSPLLLLLAPCLVHGASDSSLQSHALRRRDAQADILDARRETEPPVDRTTTGRSSQATKPPYKGTEDAPVDGLDGKPHAGPFVDTARDEEDSKLRDSAKPASLDRFASSTDERWRLEDIPERNDGVMNDDSRIAPKKGTTGTEGGISEKERLRKEQETAENRPQQPKEALAEEDLSGVYSSASRSQSSDELKRGSSYTGLERPDNLPSRSGSSTNTGTHGEEPPVDASNNGWLRATMPETEGKTNPKPPASGRQKLPSAASLLPGLSDEESWHEWFHSFVLSLTMILFSEIGDKTFLVAALMAMRHSPFLVFSAAFSALVVMTVLSAVLGHVVPTLLPKRLTTFAAALLFLVFGAKMLREGLAMPKDLGVGEEMKEVEAELEEKEHTLALSQSRRRGSSNFSPYALEAGHRGRTTNVKLPNGTGEPSPPASRSPSPPSGPTGLKGTLSGLMNLCSLVLSPAWVQTFVMTFLGEWGDRSQIATIAMAAGQDYWRVTLGAVLGHACCTGLAVVGGRALAGRVSMRVVTLGGAIAFLVFGFIYLVECITE